MAQTANMVGIERTRALGTIGATAQVRSVLMGYLHTDFDSAFFNQAEFGTSVSYIHYGTGVTKSYKDLFDMPTQDIRAGSNTEILAAKPQIMLSTSHMSHAPNINDVIIKNGTRFTIDSFEDDGVGVVTIYLVREGQRFA